MIKAALPYYHLYLLVVYGRCLPGTIDTLSEELQEVLNKTQGELEDVLVGQSGVINIVAQAKEVWNAISVCMYFVFVF